MCLYHLDRSPGQSSLTCGITSSQSLCCAVLCCAVLCGAVLCCAVLCYAALRCAVLDPTMQCQPILQFDFWTVHMGNIISQLHMHTSAAIKLEGLWQTCTLTEALCLQRCLVLIGKQTTINLSMRSEFSWSPNQPCYVYWPNTKP